MLLLLRLLCFPAWVFALRTGFSTLMAAKAINGHEFFLCMLCPNGL